MKPFYACSKRESIIVSITYRRIIVVNVFACNVYPLVLYDNGVSKIFNELFQRTNWGILAKRVKYFIVENISVYSYWPRGFILIKTFPIASELYVGENALKIKEEKSAYGTVYGAIRCKAI